MIDSLEVGITSVHPNQLISYFFQKQNEGDFAKLFDDTLRQIIIDNSDIFSIKSSTGHKDRLFNELSKSISDSSQRDAFCKALINKLSDFSFEEMFGEK